MGEYVKRTLPSGDVIKYRKTPPVDSNGKALPTKKQLRARAQASKRMKLATQLLRKKHGDALLPGTPEYGAAMSEFLTKNTNETGKRRSRLPKKRAVLCRKDGKISRC